MVDLELTNVTALYDTRRGAAAGVRGVSFRMAAGEFVAIVGRSGAGKSTLLNAIAGLRPVNGSITMTPASASGRIGYAFQNPRLLPWLTVRENIALPLRLGTHVGQRAVPVAVDELLAMFRISHLALRLPGECSEGERARASCARALIVRPAILLLDEPFSHVDQLSAEDIRTRLLESWGRERSSVILVTHDLTEAALAADRILVLTSAGIAGEYPIRAGRLRHFDMPDVIAAQRRVRSALEACYAS